MNRSAIQSYMAGLIAAHPNFAAASIKVDNSQAQAIAKANGSAIPVDARGIIIDDGTFPKIPSIEATLKRRGLVIVIYRLESFGLIDTSQTGVSNSLLSLSVFIQELVSVNRATAVTDATTPTGILALDAGEYVCQALQGKRTGLDTPILPAANDFTDLGNGAGLWTIIQHFSKQHRITPI